MRPPEADLLLFLTPSRKRLSKPRSSCNCGNDRNAVEWDLGLLRGVVLTACAWEWIGMMHDDYSSSAGSNRQTSSSLENNKVERTKRQDYHEHRVPRNRIELEGTADEVSRKEGEMQCRMREDGRWWWRDGGWQDVSWSDGMRARISITIHAGTRLFLRPSSK
jgi:hypothetical protein